MNSFERRIVAAFKQISDICDLIPIQHGDAELGIHMGCHDVLVRVRLNARIDPQEDTDLSVGALDLADEFLCFHDIVDDDCADAAIQRHTDFIGCFVVAVEEDL